MSSRRLWGGSSRRLSALFLVVVLPPAATLVWLGLQLVEQDRSLWAQRELEGRQAAAEAIVYSLNQSLADAERHLSDGEVPPGAVRFVMSPQGVKAHPPTRLLWLPTLPVMPAAEAAPFTEAEIFEFQGGRRVRLRSTRSWGHSTSPAVRAGALVRVARVHRRERRWNDALTAYRRLAEISGIAIYDIPVDLLARRAIYQPRYPPDIAEKTEDQVAEDFLRDASAERWGAIGEIGSSMTMHPDERKVVRASCTVHLRTGLPLFTHTPHEGCRQCALEQLDIIDRWV